MLNPAPMGTSSREKCSNLISLQNHWVTENPFLRFPWDVLICCIPVTPVDVAETEGMDLLSGTNEIQKYCTFREHFDFAHIEVCRPQSDTVMRRFFFQNVAYLFVWEWYTKQRDVYHCI